MKNKAEQNKEEQIKMYKFLIGDFVNCNFILNGSEKIAKGVLKEVSSDGKLLIVGDYKKFVIDISSIKNLNSGAVKNE